MYMYDACSTKSFDEGFWSSWHILSARTLARSTKAMTLYARLRLGIFCLYVTPCVCFQPSSDTSPSLVRRQKKPPTSQTIVGVCFQPSSDTSPSLVRRQKKPPTSQTIVGASGRTESSSSDEECSVCIIGGGVSGLAAAITIGERQGRSSDADNDDDDDDEHQSVILLEAGPTIGGRVQSDKTDDGYTLDRGFAVFLEEYPNSKALLDYDALDLCPFDPGALVKLSDSGPGALSRVADPLRQPKRLWSAATSPVGTVKDKVRLVPLLVHVMKKSIDELFAEEETDTLTCLKDRWRFSRPFIDEFLAPFLEGIYLTPLNSQSSRMFHFVFKMFSVGNVSLPRRGIGAVSEQLAAKAKSLGVDIRTHCTVETIRAKQEEEEGFTVTTQSGRKIHADKVILATDVKSATHMILSLTGNDQIADFDDAVIERSVGCLYYTFDSEPPIDEPILVLNGAKGRGTRGSPINNVCFPSVVCSDYSPSGSHLCSVTILEKSLEEYDGKDDELDVDVRRQLSSWFPSHADAIIDPDTWRLKRIYRVDGAQPAQFGCSYPANANGGRDATSFRGAKVPRGMFVAGDHISTSSLNGALGSGIVAGEAVINSMKK